MLGLESERKLKNFFVAVGDGERALEFARASLCNISDFAPRSSFERIDRDASREITSREICTFLRDNGIYHVSESEAHTLVQFFDNNGNGRLSFDEFQQMLLPCEDNFLRNRTLDRPARVCGRYDHLPRDIEQAVCNVIEKEIDLQRTLESHKRDLAMGYDYSAFAAFRSVDRYPSGRINTFNLGDFLRTNGHYASEVELTAIIRRIDADGDASVTESELADFLRPAFPGTPPRPASPPRASSPSRSSSPLKASASRRSMSASPSRSSPSRAEIALDRSRQLEADLAKDRYYASLGVRYPYYPYSSYYPYYSRYYPYSRYPQDPYSRYPYYPYPYPYTSQSAYSDYMWRTYRTVV